MTVVASDGTRTPLEPASFSGVDFGSLPGTPTNFYTNTATGSVVPYGVLQGMLFGPGAGEISGFFASQIALSPSGEPIHAQGAFAVVRRWKRSANSVSA
jgi:hypothetical protein